MVRVKNGRCEIEKENGPFDAGLVVTAEGAYDEEDEPEEAHHHRKRNYPGV